MSKSKGVSRSGSKSKTQLSKGSKSRLRVPGLSSKRSKSTLKTSTAAIRTSSKPRLSTKEETELVAPPPPSPTASSQAELAAVSSTDLKVSSSSSSKSSSVSMTRRKENLERLKSSFNSQLLLQQPQQQQQQPNPLLPVKLKFRQSSSKSLKVVSREELEKSCKSSGSQIEVLPKMKSGSAGLLCMNSLRSGKDVESIKSLTDSIKAKSNTTGTTSPPIEENTNGEHQRITPTEDLIATLAKMIEKIAKLDNRAELDAEITKALYASIPWSMPARSEEKSASQKKTMEKSFEAAKDDTNQATRNTDEFHPEKAQKQDSLTGTKTYNNDPSLAVVQNGCTTPLPVKSTGRLTRSTLAEEMYQRLCSPDWVSTSPSDSQAKEEEEEEVGLVKWWKWAKSK